MDILQESVEFYKNAGVDWQCKRYSTLPSQEWQHISMQGASNTGGSNEQVSGQQSLRILIELHPIYVLEEIRKGSFKMYIDRQTEKTLISLLQAYDIPPRILNQKNLGNPKNWLFFLSNIKKRKPNQSSIIFVAILNCLLELKIYLRSALKLGQAMILIMKDQISKACDLLRLRNKKSIERTLRLNQIS